jgi:RNA polymerase sigma factor (sigma-70 family)
LPTKSDHELIAACLSGESWGWDALVDRYSRLVYTVALRAGLTPADAEDVFQTVFIRLLENLQRLREPQAIAAWLITTAKRASWNLLRKEQREPAIAEWLLRTQPEETLWADQTMVHDALEQVGERCKELLWLLYYDKDAPSYEAISQRLKMPLGSIGPTRARCLDKLREILQTMGMR